MQAALEAAGLVPAWDAVDPAPATSRPATAPAGDAGPNPNRAQRRAEERRARAIALREQGLAIKNIARELRCSERAVYAYLQDPQ